MASHNGTNRLFCASMPDVYIFYFIVLVLRLWRFKMGGQAKVKGRREHVAFTSSSHPSPHLSGSQSWMVMIAIGCEDTA